MFRPSAWIIEYKAACFAIQFFLFEKFGYTDGFDRPSSRVSNEKFKAFLLQGSDAELMRDVHQTFDIVPSDSALQAG